MPNILTSFQRSLEIYTVKGPFLPKKLSWKLDLILCMIKDKIPDTSLFSIEQKMEFQDLESFDIPNLQILFNNIIETLFDEQKVDKKKCLIKKKGFFTNWQTASIHESKNYFAIIFANKSYNFEKKNCKIIKSKQSKRVLEFYFKDYPKYNMKFKDEEQMNSIWQIWQSQIINHKTEKNYEDMKTLFEIQIKANLQTKPFTNSPSQSQAISSLQEHKNLLSNFDQLQKNRLKPVPHNFACRLRMPNSLIALSKDNEARVYIELLFACNLQKKSLLSFLILQKSWNHCLSLETVEEADERNEVYISRKYNTLNELDQLVELNLKVLYTQWNSQMSIITVQSLNNNVNDLQLNSVITIQWEKQQIRILIDEQLISTKHKPQKLKKALFQMYKEIVNLAEQKNIFEDFQAQKIVASMLEDQEWEDTASSEQIQALEAKKFCFFAQERNKIQNSRMPSSSKQIACPKILVLKSPLEKPDLQYIESIKNGEFQKHYFKFNFSQSVLNQYNDETPPHQLSKMIQNKFYEITNQRQLKFTDYNLISCQKQILKFVLRQIGTNFIAGKSVLNVSLPVDIFDTKTELERNASSFAICPDYLLPCAQSTTLEQIKSVTGFIANVSSGQLGMHKPFSSVLGQTFQGYIKGIPICYEQISHHPPISSYYIKCPEFNMYGNVIPFAELGLNSAIGGNLGLMHIVFENGSHFQCYIPPSQVSGLLYGDRKFRSYGKGFILERKSRLYSEFSVQNSKKGVYEIPKKLKEGQIIGGIFEVKEQFITDIDRYRNHHKNFKKFYGITKQMIVKKHASITGEWFTKILINSEAINQNVKFYPVEYPTNILPSDSNHRLDVLYRKINDLPNSQRQKENLENAQRIQKKLREKYSLQSSH